MSDFTRPAIIDMVNSEGFVITSSGHIPSYYIHDRMIDITAYSLHYPVITTQKDNNVCYVWFTNTHHPV